MRAKKAYKLAEVRKAISNFKYEEMGYPEWSENGVCRWNDIPEEGWYDLTENDQMKLINEGILVYSKYDETYVPCTILDAHTGKWLI